MLRGLGRFRCRTVWSTQRPIAASADLISSAPEMRPIGSPARSRSSAPEAVYATLSAPCDEAAINVMPGRRPRLRPPSGSSCHRMSLYSSCLARVGARHGCFRNIPRSRPREFYRGTDCPQVSIGFKGRPFARRCAGSVSACQTFSGGWAEFSDEHERPLFWALSYLLGRAGPGRVFELQTLIICFSFLAVSTGADASGRCLRMDRLPAFQLRDLDEIAAPYPAASKSWMPSHPSAASSNSAPQAFHPLVICLQVVSKEHGRGLVLAERAPADMLLPPGCC